MIHWEDHNDHPSILRRALELIEDAWIWRRDGPAEDAETWRQHRLHMHRYRQLP